MVIIAFSSNTSKTLPRIVCKKFCHVAPIVQTPSGMILYQFIRPRKFIKIPITRHGLQLIKNNNWHMIYLHNKCDINFNPTTPVTCVDMTRQIIGMRRRVIQTPYGLYCEICKQNAP